MMKGANLVKNKALAIFGWEHLPLTEISIQICAEGEADTLANVQQFLIQNEVSEPIDGNW